MSPEAMTTEIMTFELAFSRDFLNEQGDLAFGEIGLHLLKESAVHYRFLETYHDPVTAAQIAETDGMAIIFPHITRETFARGAARLTVIARCGVGYDRVDLDACTKHGVALVNAPQAMKLPTAAGSLMFMLALSKKLMAMDRIVRQGEWERRGDLRGVELSGRTLGIVGLGNSGRELARLVAPFNMNLLAYSPRADPEQAHQLGVMLTSLETLLRQADFVCLHCRLTEQTRGLIGAGELALMKPGAYLINMARGPVVDHTALLVALQEQRIAGAGLDVFYEEPLPADDPITRLDNVILTPHWAAGTLDVYYEAGTSNCRAMVDVACGRLPENIVNGEVIGQPAFQAKLDRFRCLAGE